MEAEIVSLKVSACFRLVATPVTRGIWGRCVLACMYTSNYHLSPWAVLGISQFQVITMQFFQLFSKVFHMLFHLLTFSCMFLTLLSPL